jgi:acetyl esterase
MAGESTPLVAAHPRGVSERVVLACARGLIGASLLVSPRPTAILLRRAFAAGGARTAEVLDRHAPHGVAVVKDERYGDGPDLLLDVYRPAAEPGQLPLLLWVHGGGFVGGSKDELAGYFELIAHCGYVVAAPRYSLAPEHRYPTPVRQAMQALAHLQANAGRLGIDAGRIALGGDSAGAHIAAQLGAIVTTPGYADAVGVAPTIGAVELRALVLACGPYDLGLARASQSPSGARFIRTVLWSYSGRRNPVDDPAFASWSVTDHVTNAFPPSLVTVGNADPLRPHSELLVERLQAQGVEVETLLYPDDHRPPLGHEYQFDLDTDEGQAFLERLLDFLGRRLGA